MDKITNNEERTLKGKFLGQAGDQVYLVWQGYEESLKKYPYHFIHFKSRYKEDYIKGTVQKDFFANKFSEPLLCKIDTITYEFPHPYTYAYLREMNLTEINHNSESCKEQFSSMIQTYLI